MARVPPAEIESDGTDIFVRYAGKRIAKRGHPNTPHAMNWVSLEPGFVVTPRRQRDHYRVQQRACAVGGPLRTNCFSDHSIKAAHQHMIAAC